MLHQHQQRQWRQQQQQRGTPLIAQYLRIKRQYQDAILFFRLGDFYETFFEDAKIASKELDIVLTSRDKGLREGERVPLAGVPYHAVESYIAKLIKRGYKVAICEQVEDPALAKGLVKREVVRVVTPGTLLEASMLDAKSNNFLVSIVKADRGIGIAAVDISTGEFIATELHADDDDDDNDNELNLKLVAELTRLAPAECILPENLTTSKEQKFIDELKQQSRIEFTVTPYSDDKFIYEIAKEQLQNHYGVVNIESFGFSNDMKLAVSSAGAILSYIQDTQKSTLHYLKSPRVYYQSEFLMLDHTTLRNLELLRNVYDGSRRGTLIEVLDHTVTSMGSRLLHKWLLRPLIDLNEINRRLDAVELFYNNIFDRHDLRELLKRIHDIERLSSRISYGNANARDLIALRNSLKQLPTLNHKITEILAKTNCELLAEIQARVDTLEDLTELITNAIVDDPPTTVKDGGIIKTGYNRELDELRTKVAEGKRWLEQLEARERARTGIKTLKVGYTSVFGYYIEITKPNLKYVPKDYIRKQTLVNAERFITPELKEQEAFIISADEKTKDLEFKLFTQIRERISKEVTRIQTTAGALAQLDCILTFAEVSSNNNYKRPVVNNTDKLIIRGGRHPVVEQVLQSQFVPNDTKMDCDANRILIITGPNMAGKSTYIRQVAQIVILAQMGCFVPADEAIIGIVDRIFTRVGAFDDLTRGQSTFMVEMVELANILNSATSKSLILLDEVGRGTSTFDGLSIAWAIVEYLHDKSKVGAKTLFATHYHHLTSLETQLVGVKNYNIAVKETGGEIIFLHKIVPGPTDKSYGIQVAKLAGIPITVINRAQEVLSEIEADDKLIRQKAGSSGSKKYTQLLLFNPVEYNQHQRQQQLINSKLNKHQAIVDELQKLDIMRITPLQALEKLYELQKRIKSDDDEGSEYEDNN